MRNPGTSERPEETGTANLRYFVQSVVVSLLTYAGKTAVEPFVSLQLPHNMKK